MERSKADSFTAFLKEKQRLKAMQQPQQGATPLSLLTTLATVPLQPGGPAGYRYAQMSLRDLLAASGMSITSFADALKTLQGSGYLTLSGTPPDEVATLTPLGTDVAQLTRPR